MTDPSVTPPIVPAPAPYAPTPHAASVAPAAPGAIAFEIPVKPRPNVLGRIALVLVLLAGLAPYAGFIYVVVNGGWPGEHLGGELSGLSGLSGIFFALLVAAIAAPVAIIGLVLGIISVTLKGRGKIAGVLAIVLGVLPSLGIFLWLILKGITNQP